MILMWAGCGKHCLWCRYFSMGGAVSALKKAEIYFQVSCGVSLNSPSARIMECVYQCVCAYIFVSIFIGVELSCKK